MSEILKGLNDKQREAALCTEGPLLVLAGAGSGKTRVLTYRIAHLVHEKGVSPWNIIAITFTNKAAKEMKERLVKLIGEKAEDMWVSTFHSSCVRILRREIEKIGYDRSFVIYDTSDQQVVIKDCIKELGINDKNFPQKSILAEISKAKNELIDSETFAKMYDGDYRMGKISSLYSLYQKKLHKNNALDFDDIIMLTVKLFNENSDVLEYYQNKFRYILVDEYQDTNTSQYMFVSLIAGGHRNLCVVGDDDQSIYRFRGANIRNILDFEKEFNDAKCIKLEQNYRSTQSILDAANNVIKNNRGRKGKNLWTDNGVGDKIKLLSANDGHDEARMIAEEIQKLVREENRSYSDFAILYRMNAQSRVIEDIMLRQGIPYRVLGGLRFYDRKEIKDIVAYLRIIHNTNDNVSLKRIVNEPKRGIGLKTIEKAEEIASERDLSLFDVIKNAYEYPELSRAAVSLVDFASIMKEIMKNKSRENISKIVNDILEKTQYLKALEAEKSVEAESRIENLKEFVSSAVEFEKGATEATLEAFLETISLVADVDNYDEAEDAIVMMTLHSAKGLEFPVVFLCAMEEGIFPSFRAFSEEDELQEERRLCYVGITRAREKLFIAHAFSRNLYGNTMYNNISRFIQEIPDELIHREEKEEKVQKIQNTFKTVDSNRFKERSPFIKNSIFADSLIVSGESNESKNSNNINNDNNSNNNSNYNDSNSNIYGRTNITGNHSNSGISHPKYSVGDVVTHKKFGRGMITGVQPIGNDSKLEIAFDSVGTKHLMAVYANLQKE